MTKVAVIIPARYGSTRFPGKPLAPLGGKPVIRHVFDNAQGAATGRAGITVHVATDDARIEEYCKQHAIPVIMTAEDFISGTDRVMNAASQLPERPDFVLNLQGDAPFTPADFIAAVIDDYLAEPSIDIVTPVTQMTWAQLDTLRQNKLTTPFSGTTVTLSPERRTLWFSKNIIPAIRKEENWRAASPISPVYRHIGLYGYTYAALERYVELGPSAYEILEGLEQLRALENGLSMRGVVVDYAGRPSMSGIDSPEDLARAEKIFADYQAKSI